MPLSKHTLLFFFVAIFNIAGTRAFAQSEHPSFIHIECPVNKYLKGYEHDFWKWAIISGQLENGKTYDTGRIEFSSASNLTLGPFPRGVYHIAIYGEINIKGRVDLSDDRDFHGGLYDPCQFYFVKVFTSIVVKDGETTLLKGEFPDDCIYFKAFAERECPKCHKKDNVVPIFYYENIDENLRYTADQWYYVPRKFNGCEHMVYCKDDKLEF